MEIFHLTTTTTFLSGTGGSGGNSCLGKSCFVTKTVETFTYEGDTRKRKSRL